MPWMGMCSWCNDYHRTVVTGPGMPLLVQRLS